MVQLLLESGVDVNGTDGSGGHRAASRRATELKSFACSPAVPTRVGAKRITATALEFATYSGCLDAAGFLKAHE